MSLASLGEFGLIELIKNSFDVPSGIKGIGDDCAVIPQVTGLDTLISTDMLVEGIHFIRSDISAFDLGWKSAAVNFSDIAAMGGRPTGSFLSFALPRELDEAWIMEFIEGFRKMSEQAGDVPIATGSGACVPLLGGDTTASPGIICINVTVTGECRHGSAKLRSAAEVGDLVCVSGPLGDSAAGLQIVLDRQQNKECQDAVDKEIESYLLNRHYHPLPRVSEALSLSGNEGVHAMMDISDGLASDLMHILKASGKGAVIDLPSIPLSSQMSGYCSIRGLDRYALAAGGGEDYELLFTMEPSCRPSVPCHVIGRICEGNAIEWKGGSRDYKGFRHF